jgi:predicted DNA-binding transcriptional regulator AlpA
MSADRHSESQRAATRARKAIADAGGLVTPQEIAREWGLTPQALADRINRGTFPPPVKIAGRVRLYLRADLEPYREATTAAGAATAAAIKARRS